MSDETKTDTEAEADPQAEEATEKEQMARDLYEVHMEIQRLEKKKAYFKDKLDPMMAEGERVADCVEKQVTRRLMVGDKLLGELEERFGAGVVKRSVNTPRLRDLMKDDPKLDELIPRKRSVSIRVGDKWGG